MCTIAAKFFKDIGWVGSKNRDRNYKPTVTIKQSFRGGIERLYLYDNLTKYTEGLNEYGIAILSAAVAVKDDEKEGIKADTENRPSPDGLKIRKALLEKTPEKVLSKLVELKLPGNTLIFTKKDCWILEATYTNELNKKKDYIYKTKKMSKDESIARTNHGVLITSGYNKEDDYESWKSSVIRQEKALKGVKNCKSPLDMIDAISDNSDTNYMMNPLRITKTHGTNTLKTTGQLMLVPSENTLHYRPVWCNIDFSTFSKINNNKSKCFYEIISSKKLLTLKEYINNINIKGKIKMEKFDEIVEAIIDGTYVHTDTVLNEGKVTDKKSLLEYAKSLGEEVFGDDMDETKIKDMVDNAIEKADKDGETDWETASGIIQTSITGK